MISSTIKRIRKKNYLNQTEFANRIGVTQGAVSQWENGLTRPNLDQIRAISAAFDVPVGEIVEETTQKRPINIDWSRDIKRAVLPILGNIACGKQITPDTEPEGYADLPDGVHADFALRCKGNSMEPTFIDGDLVLIRQQPEVENGQIAAVNIEDETTLKHVYRQNNGLLLVADNPEYSPIYAPFSEDKPIIIHGLAVGYTRIFY
jgi:repressor LexA